MTSKLLSHLKNNLFNWPGLRTNRKIIVFESDDWGSVRMPSKRIYEKLLETGIRVDLLNYNRFDSLENGADLEALFEVLSSTRDKAGRFPVFTFNTVMGNPDFERIKKDGFQCYHFESFNASYNRYWGRDFFFLWKEGMDEGIICPQFHAKEHLNVSLWMDALQNGYKETLEAFEYGYYGLTTRTPSPHQKRYLAAFHVTDILDLAVKKNALCEGLQMFEHVFGFKSASFIPCNYTWPTDLEKTAFDKHVTIIQGQRAQLAPNLKTGRIEIVRHYSGQQNRLGQNYFVRNCFFEPSSNTEADWVSTCLGEIANSFFWRKPAIISSHRVNFIGSLDESNRMKNLNLLRELLKNIVNRWPDVEFLSTPELKGLMES